MKPSLTLLFVAIGATLFSMWSPCCAQFSGDLSRSTLLSIDWLVDESSVIVVARFPDAENKNEFAGRRIEAKPELIRTIKGSFEDLQWPLEMPFEIQLGQHAGPPVGGRVRLLFIRGTSELLQSVKLGRDYNFPPTLWDKWHGITQFGEMLLTESALYHAIDERLQAQRPSAPNTLIHVDISRDALLQVHSDRLWLRVPAGLERRDHYIKLLKSGDAAERIYSIRLLAKMNDEQATAAIRAAVHCEHVTPVYHDQGIGGGSWPEEWNTDSVRAAAAEAIKLIDTKT